MDRKRIGELVKSRREALRLSLRNAASLTDGAVAFSTWQQVESGELNWSVDKLGAILYALDAHLEVNLRPGRWDQPADPVRRELLDRLAAIADRLPAEAIRSLLAQVEVYEETLGGPQNQSNR